MEYKMGQDDDLMIIDAIDREDVDEITRILRETKYFDEVSRKGLTHSTEKDAWCISEVIIDAILSQKDKNKEKIGEKLRELERGIRSNAKRERQEERTKYLDLLVADKNEWELQKELRVQIEKGEALEGEICSHIQSKIEEKQDKMCKEACMNGDYRRIIVLLERGFNAEKMLDIAEAYTTEGKVLVPDIISILRDEIKKKEMIKELDKRSTVQHNLKAGDTVKWTNDYGVEWEHEVLGFKNEEMGSKGIKEYARLDSDAWWFPHDTSTLTKIKTAKNIVIETQDEKYICVLTPDSVEKIEEKCKEGGVKVNAIFEMSEKRAKVFPFSKIIFGSAQEFEDIAGANMKQDEIEGAQYSRKR